MLAASNNSPERRNDKFIRGSKKGALRGDLSDDLRLLLCRVTKPRVKLRYRPPLQLFLNFVVAQFETA